MSTEKRKHPRRIPKMKFPVLIQHPEGEYEGFIYDFGLVGMAIFCTKALARGEKIKIAMVNRPEWGPLPCVVNWIQACPTRGIVISPNFPIYKVGVAFEPQSEQEKKFIESLDKEI